MLYIKGLFVGTITLVMAIVVYIGLRIWWTSRAYASLVPPGGEIGFDLSSLLYSPVFWLVASLGFAVGFVWSLRGSTP
jgi:hypothetical protein